MKTAVMFFDVLVYICGAAVIGVGAYVIMRFFKGEVKRHKRNSD